jgi:hypothetical protein
MKALSGEQQLYYFKTSPHLVIPQTDLVQFVPMVTGATAIYNIKR